MGRYSGLFMERFAGKSAGIIGAIFLLLALVLTLELGQLRAAEPASPPPAAAAAASAEADIQVISPPSAPRPTATARDILKMVAFAFLGGLILNIMPCVLPVISLKVLGFVNQASQSPKRVRQLGLVYSLGVVVSFLVLAGLVIGLKQAGKAVSWGIQFGNPQFIVALIVLVTLVALNLFGVFEVTLGSSVSGSVGELAQKEGSAGAFFNGVLAVVLATPCTAPFLGVSMGFALSQPAYVILLAFLAAGLGLAFPYVVLCWNSGLLRILPRPGAWMESFKIAMGFPMLATVIWLFNTALSHFGERVTWLGFFLILLSASAWIYGRFVQRPSKRLWLPLTCMALLLSLGYFGILESRLQWRNPPKLSGDSRKVVVEPGGIEWKPWSHAAIKAARAEGRVIMVDFTAEWCPNCKANMASSINIPSVRAKLKELNVLTLEADYTATPDDMTEEITRWGRGGIPLVLIYPRNPDLPPKALPEFLTPSIVLQALQEADQAKR